jgi:MFS family permease
MINYAICIPIVFIKAMLLTAGLLIGFPFGCFACLGEAYASEICPVKLRAYMTGYVNICWNIGMYSTHQQGQHLTLRWICFQRGHQWNPNDSQQLVLENPLRYPMALAGPCTSQ